jgi:hypothetical protein
MSPIWYAVIIVSLLLALAVWAWRWTSQRSSGRNDRYTAERVVSPEQVQMLDYLQDTFPKQVILVNISLKDMLSVRRATDRKRAEVRLTKQRVDFVVCNQDGRPAFAFDIEQYHLSDAKAKGFQAKIKNRILKTAGVRFVYLKNGIHRMPSPADFREQLNLAALPQPKPEKPKEDRDSVIQQLESQFSEFDQLGPVTGFRDSEVMGVSGLMELGKGGPRKHSPTNSHSSDALSSGHSGFDGGTMDVRGG